MTQETRKFDAEVGKVLHLMIHSLYTNKEIFMREIISNSADACDKLRYLAVTDPDLTKDDPEFKIVIKIDKEQRKITISDNGIGMNKDDLINNLGTIAHSGTQHFLEKMTGDAKKDNLLIGQFGVGFYSSYMVADQVTVISKKAGEKNAYQWESKGLGEYTVSDVEKDTRGTDIILHIKEGEDTYLDHFRVKHIVKSYSDHISIPIYYFDAESKNENQINSSSALWTRSKSDISDEDYQEFYKNISFSADQFWLKIHNRNEGNIEFTNLLFIPSEKTFDLFHPDRKRRVKLYIKRVFITDEGIDLIPPYLRFLRGVVDCESLPLNISRETLQHNPVIEKIKNTIVKKVLSELNKQKDSHREDYEKFWINFGAAFKEGLCEGLADHDKLLEVCLFKSAIHDKYITLDEYISNMPADQKVIYYLSGDNADKLKNSPQIEELLRQDIDVLLFTDHVDDFWGSHITKYKDHEIKSATRADVDTNKKVDDKNFNKLIELFKSTLGDAVKDVCISKKLSSSPVCLSVAEGSMDMRMERFLLDQKQLASASAKILEINPDHSIIMKIQHDLEKNAEVEENIELIKLLFDQACIIEGETLKDVTEFCKRMNHFVEKSI